MALTQNQKLRTQNSELLHPSRLSQASAVAVEAFVNNAGESEGLCHPASDVWD
jgi:hypothetical protein